MLATVPAEFLESPAEFFVSVVLAELDVVADPLVPAAAGVLPGPLDGDPVWLSAGDEVADDDDGVGSGVGDGFGPADLVPVGVAVPVALVALVALEQWVGVGLGAARWDAAAVVTVEFVAAAAVVWLPVAAGVVLALPPGDVSGLVLGLPVPVGGAVEGLAGVVVGGVLDWLGRTELADFGVVDVFGVAAGVQDEAAVGAGRLWAVPGMPTAPPLG